MKTYLAAILVLACACRAPMEHGGFGTILERGGELGPVRLDDTEPQIGARDVIAWGVIEVPDGSRLQAAYAGVDAIARAELLKLIAVRVADVTVSVDSTDPARRQAYEHTIEAVSGSLRQTGTTAHAWERVQQRDRVVLRVWSRLTVPRAALDAALQAVHGTLEVPAALRDGRANEAN